MMGRFIHSDLIHRVTATARGEFIRFVLVGGTFAGLYVILATILTHWLDFSYGIASSLAYLLMIPPAYIAQKKLAFQSSASDQKAFPRYLLLQLASLGTASGSAHLLSISANFNPVWVYMISAGIAITTNFLLIKFWVLAE